MGWRRGATARARAEVCATGAQQTTRDITNDNVRYGEAMNAMSISRHNGQWVSRAAWEGEVGRTPPPAPTSPHARSSSGPPRCWGTTTWSEGPVDIARHFTVCHLTQDMRVHIACRGSMTWRAMGLGLADIDCHVAGCHSTQETRIQNALDDVESTI